MLDRVLGAVSQLQCASVALLLIKKGSSLVPIAKYYMCNQNVVSLHPYMNLLSLDKAMMLG